MPKRKRHRWGARKGWMGRFPVPRNLARPVQGVTFIPYDPQGVEIPGEPVIIYPDEVEALRLVYLEGRTQEEAAQQMGVSRGTVWRLLDSARRKLALAVSESRPIIVVSSSGV